MFSTQKELLLLLAVATTIMISDVTSKPSNNARHANVFTRALGNKEFRICKARTFSFFLHAVCLHHRPHIQFKKVAIRSTSESLSCFLIKRLRPSLSHRFLEYAGNQRITIGWFRRLETKNTDFSRKIKTPDWCNWT